MRRFITIATDDLARLLELSAQYPYAVFEDETNTDGEEKWHCDVEYYDEQGDRDPIEVFSFSPTRDDYEMDEERDYKTYVRVRDQYIGEDIKNIAEERGVKLDEATIKEMVEEYIDSHDMTVSERDALTWLVDKYGKEDNE